VLITTEKYVSDVHRPIVIKLLSLSIETH